MIFLLEEKIQRLISVAEHKNQSNTRNLLAKTKGHVSIRPTPLLQAVAPLKIEVPVVHAGPRNVQMCVVPTLNAQLITQVKAVGVQDAVVKSVIQMLK